ncbi:phage tail protein [Clostridium formicaceticum]|nr:tail fiber protein [Clostridium formicaceticum]AOY78481.1 phage tail protein [Clostridium formicaceticum]
MESLLGQIELFPYDFEPYNWARCDGRLLSISKYTALFSLIGTHYGGDGKITFALPNLKGTEPVPGTNYYIALDGMYPQRP